MGQYVRALPTVLGVIAMALVASLSDDVIDTPEWIQIATQGFTALQVFITANLTLPFWKYTKGITAGALAALGTITAVVANDGDLTQSIILNAVVAALFAAGVLISPRTPGEQRFAPEG